MNRDQLNRLLSAGLITHNAHTAALTALSAGHTAEPGIVRTHELSAANVGVNRTARTITVTAAAYDTFIPSHALVLDRGSLTPRTPAKANKLLVDHDLSHPVGYMASYDADSLATTYHVPETPDGDQALTDIANGLRDGASVGFTITDHRFDTDGTLHVLAADWYETSLVSVPAVAGAGVTNVTATIHRAQPPKETPLNRAQLAAALAAGTITQEQYDTAIAVLDAAVPEPTPAPGPATPTTPTTAPPAAPAPSAGEAHDLALGPQHVAGAPTPVIVTERALSLAEVTQRVALAARTQDVAAVQGALTDVIPADDAGTAFVNRPDWIGELFTAREVGRPWIDSFGVPKQLTSMKTKGYRITERPRPGKYPGDKTQVPSEGKFKTSPEEFTANRWAGGWDIDRLYVDFGDAAFLDAFWRACTEEYQVDSDADIASQVIAKATATGQTGTATGVLPAITSIASAFRRIKGAKLDRIKIGAGLFDEYANLKDTDIPFWLKKALGTEPDLAGGTATVARLVIEEDTEVADDTLVGYDHRAATVREKSPIQVRAYDIARGGIDLGFYSYGLIEFHDPRLFRSVTVAPVTPPDDGGEEPGAGGQA